MQTYETNSKRDGVFSVFEQEASIPIAGVIGLTIRKASLSLLGMS